MTLRARTVDPSELHRFWAIGEIRTRISSNLSFIGIHIGFFHRSAKFVSNRWAQCSSEIINRDRLCVTRRVGERLQGRLREVRRLWVSPFREIPSTHSIPFFLSFFSISISHSSNSRTHKAYRACMKGNRKAKGKKTHRGEDSDIGGKTPSRKIHLIRSANRIKIPFYFYNWGNFLKIFLAYSCDAIIIHSRETKWLRTPRCW